LIIPIALKTTNIKAHRLGHSLARRNRPKITRE
jgi:hypothetical protein